MPFLLTTLRRAPTFAGPSSQSARARARAQARTLTTTSSFLAAAATAPRTYVRKLPAKPTSSPTKAAPTPASASASAPRPIMDDFPDDFPPSLSDQSMIEDYSHLNPSPTSTSSSTSSDPSLGYSLPTIATSLNEITSAGTSTSTSSIPGEVPAAPVMGKSGEDWSISFSGLSERPFESEVAEKLLRPLSVDDVEVKPDGLLYLPEIKYRRTLNAAFGPGGWGLAPRGETHVGTKIVSREWGLVCLGRLVAIARGEQEFFDPSGIATATEACKSNALMRCCKDLGIASELWDPSFIREFKKKYCVEVFVEHVTKKNKKKLWRKKNSAKFDYPWKETS
ncbi:hypothetical protein IAR55_003900 [Kwoniella newhampshirensis]|uniref:Mitochondrial genome maintenance protein MGM101 n=1 Tax=Kwoniella newhampshirensis TaxID=1651941 RepID=A0AAW0YY27_9TREE